MDKVHTRSYVINLSPHRHSGIDPDKSEPRGANHPQI